MSTPYILLKTRGAVYFMCELLWLQKFVEFEGSEKRRRLEVFEKLFERMEWIS